MLVSEKVTCFSAYTSRGCSRPRFESYIGGESSFTSLSQGSLLVSSRSKLSLRDPHAASLSPSSPRSIGTFLVLAKPPEARLLQLLFLVHRNSTFLYSLLKSAANAVLKLMSAVIAIAHILFVSIKSLSVIIMLLKYPIAKLKYDSTTLPMSGFLGSSPVSASRSPVSLAMFDFLN